jgi:hypothetical protein
MSTTTETYRVPCPDCTAHVDNDGRCLCADKPVERFYVKRVTSHGHVLWLKSTFEPTGMSHGVWTPHASEATPFHYRFALYHRDCNINGTILVDSIA